MPDASSAVSQAPHAGVGETASGVDTSPSAQEVIGSPDISYEHEQSEGFLAKLRLQSWEHLDGTCLAGLCGFLYVVTKQLRLPDDIQSELVLEVAEEVIRGKLHIDWDRSQKAILSFLTTTILHRCKAYKRREHIGRRAEGIAARPDHVEADPSVDIVQQDEQAFYEHLITSAPEPVRTIMIHRFLLGRSWAIAGEAVGLSDTGARRKYERYRDDHLKAKLDKHWRCVL